MLPNSAVHVNVVWKMRGGVVVIILSCADMLQGAHCLTCCSQEPLNTRLICVCVTVACCWMSGGGWKMGVLNRKRGKCDGREECSLEMIVIGDAVEMANIGW